MNMARSNQRKGDNMILSLQAKYEVLQKEHTTTAKVMKSLESRLEKLAFMLAKGSRESSS